MRILANYTHKTNGDSYSVSMETLGDCPKEQVDAITDELFQMAKSAIQRQINPEIRLEDSSHKEGVTIPEPKQANGKPAMKDPGAPISAKQKSLIIKLAKEKGEFIKGLGEMNMGDASHVIEELLAVTV